MYLTWLAGQRTTVEERIAAVQARIAASPAMPEDTALLATLSRLREVIREISVLRSAKSLDLGESRHLAGLEDELSRFSGDVES